MYDSRIYFASTREETKQGKKLFSCIYLSGDIVLYIASTEQIDVHHKHFKSDHKQITSDQIKSEVEVEDVTGVIDLLRS